MHALVYIMSRDWTDSSGGAYEPCITLASAFKSSIVLFQHDSDATITVREACILHQNLAVGVEKAFQSWSFLKERFIL